MTGIDDNDKIFMQIVGLGKESIQYYDKIKCKLLKPTLIVTDQSLVLLDLVTILAVN